MRFKFRAWDKERNEMRQVQLMDWSDWWLSTGHTWERKHALTYGERHSFDNEETDRHILMQYTGLKDQNGNEIYEGDILQNDWRIMQVVWDEGGFMLVDQTKNVWCIQDYPTNDTEVIGNIHENPDLLPKAIESNE